MKKVMSIVPMAIVSIVACAQDNYYYFHGEKVYLEERPMQRLFVPRVDEATKVGGTAYAQWFDSVQPLRGSNAWIGVVGSSYKSVADIDGIETYPLYYYKGAPVSVIEKFTVRLKEGVSYQELETLTASYGAEILSPAPYTENQYYVGVGRSGKNSLYLANRFYESGLFEFSEPQFWILDAMQTSDPYWDKQWGLSNTGQEDGMAGIDINVEEAWTVVGNDATVRVAVVDNGIYLRHPDILESLDPGYDEYGYSGGLNDALFPGAEYGEARNHGTQCAGIIAARKDNGYGIAGVAPDSRIVPVGVRKKEFDGRIGIFSDVAARGIRWACHQGHADVISLSWGFSNPSSDIESAVNEVVDAGRNGLGCVVVFSSGNEGTADVQVPMGNNSEVIVVGAVDRCGIRSGTSTNSPRSCDPWPSGSKPGSCYGDGLDVVAPGTNVYTSVPISAYVAFNGSSAACPHVSGVAALMLSVNPYLTQQEVHDIIEQTATKLPTYNFGNVSGHSNGTWNNEVGYGMVNAYAAVQAACQEVRVRNETISADKTVKSCGNIEFEDVIVKTGVKLSIDAPGEVVLGPGFEMEVGAELEMN